MNIAAMSNPALDARAARVDRAKRARGHTFELFHELANPTEEGSKAHIIKKIFAWGETSAWVGPPGSLKSALMADAAIAVASGSNWFGFKNAGPVSVIYFALERADLVRRRLLASAAARGIVGRLPIAVVPGIIDLTKPASVEKVAATIKEAEIEFLAADHDYAGLLIFDTMAKLVAAGGGDENQAKDLGAIFTNIQRIKDKMFGGPHFAFIGHTGKDTDRGARGSSALLGDVDLMVTISGAEVKTATVTKANDAPEGPLFSFKSEVHEFGTDEDGDPIAVNIVSSETVETGIPASREPKLTANQKTMFAMLHNAGTAGLLMEDWNNQAREAGIGIKRKADLTDIRNALLSKGLVRQYGDRWTVKHD